MVHFLNSSNSERNYAQSKPNVSKHFCKSHVKKMTHDALANLSNTLLDITFV